LKNEITEEQVKQYDDSGFLVIEDFLNADELQTWRTDVDEAVAQRLEATSGSANFLENNQADPDAYYSQVFTQCLKLADTHAGMHELMHDERLGRAAATLAGVDGIRIWHDQALIKPPFGNPTAWHLDNPFWSFSSRNSISIWVALDDATLGNGAMWYIPGSQKTATYTNAGIGSNLAGLFKAYPEWRKIEPVSCACPAGSAVFHNGLTAHGAGANMTNKPRRAMTCAYMPDGSMFNGEKNVLPQEYFNSLTVGDLLNDSVVNPLIYHK
jgi:ectoine hydroxylase-related dioxygenase (phytanoyl-CoA dioxygenase family)